MAYLHVAKPRQQAQIIDSVCLEQLLQQRLCVCGAPNRHIRCCQLAAVVCSPVGDRRPWLLGGLRLRNTAFGQ